MNGLFARYDEMTRITWGEGVFEMDLEVQSFLHKIHVVS